MDKEWLRLEKVIERNGVTEGPGESTSPIMLKIKENSKFFEVEAKNVDPQAVQTSIERGYLFLRQKKAGLTKIIPTKGKLLKQVCLPQQAKLVAEKADERNACLKLKFQKG